MKPCRYLLCDTNIVIVLFELGLWSAVVSACDLILTETVVDEADFFVDSAGVEHAIDLRPDIAAGRISVVGVAASDVATFRGRFDDLYVQRLDDGETESLTFCLQQGSPYRTCSADGIVFRVLAVVDHSDQGVSLEEVLQSAALGRQLPSQYTRRFQEQHRAQGLQDRLSGIGLRRR